MKGSSLGKLLLGVVVALAGFGTAGFIGIQTGNITIIFGSNNKVENRAKSDPAPAKPLAELKHEQPTTLATTQSPAAPAGTTSDVSQSALAHARRTQPAIEDDEEEACTCPDEEEVDEEEEAEPEPVPVRIRVQPQTVDNSLIQNSRVYVQGSTISVSSSSVSSSVSGGQRSRTRVVVNGQVVVDQY